MAANGENPQIPFSGRASNPIALMSLLAVAAGLRFWVANFQPNIIWPDEVFQVVEPAHRLIYGNGLTAWEYMVGMRSWLFPGVVAGVLWLGSLFGSSPASKLIPVQIFMVLASLVPVGVGYRWGERLDGIRGGLVVGGLLALWVDLLYFAPHPLSDVIAGDVLMAALYTALPLTAKPNSRRTILAGALFGLTFVLRMQLGPALLVAAVFACGSDQRSWRALLLGSGIVVLASGMLDWATLGTPFQSIWLNFWLNVGKGVSRDFGIAPAAFFFGLPLLIWGPASVLIVAQFIIGARRFPALFAVAVTIFVVQSLFLHKEWRFVFPALPVIVALCGIATVEEIKDLRAFLGSRLPSSWLLIAASLGIWCSISLLIAMRPIYIPEWTRRRELIQSFDMAARQPSLCGVELINLVWAATPGSAALPDRVPIYANWSVSARNETGGYNVAISDVIALLPSPYRRLGCYQGTWEDEGRIPRTACVWLRDGACVPSVGKRPEPNWPPYFTDKNGHPRQERIQPYLRHRS